MSTDSAFTPRSLTASEYIRELFEPADNAAILVRNRSTGHTIQTIAKLRRSRARLSNLASESECCRFRRIRGNDPIKDGAYCRTKQNIKDIRHVYLDSTRRATKLLTRFVIP